MKCYNCGTELIWGGDHDCEDDEDHCYSYKFILS